MSKFKKGDTVERIKDPTEGYLPVGTKCIVSSTRESGEIYFEGDNRGPYMQENFKLVERKHPSYVEHKPAVTIPEHTALKVSGKLTEKIHYSQYYCDKKLLALRNCHGAVDIPYLNKKEILELSEALKELASYMED